MKHYSQMSDREIGILIYDANLLSGDVESLGHRVRHMLDSVEPDELAEVRAEVDRTARVVMAFAAAGVGTAATVAANELRMLRARQRDLEAKLAAQNGTP